MVPARRVPRQYADILYPSDRFLVNRVTVFLPGLAEPAALMWAPDHRAALLPFVRPTVFYTVTKVAGETMGRFYH